jgi:hypothetical protein
VPGEEFAFDLAQPRLQIKYLPSQARNHLCRQRRHVGHFARRNTLGETQRMRDPTPYLNAKLRQQAADHVHQLGALLDQEVPCPMDRQRSLLLTRLDRDVAHRRTRYRLADRLGVARVGLPTLDVSLHIGRWHQTYLMTKLAELARPIVARTAGLDAHQTWSKPLKKPQHLHPAQRLAHNNFTNAVDGVDLINVLGQIEADGGNFHGGWLPSLVVA